MKPIRSGGRPRLAIAAGLIVIAGNLAAQPAAPTGSRLAFQHDRDVYVTAWDYLPEWRGSLLLNAQQGGSRSPLIEYTDRSGLHDRIAFELPGSWVYLHGVSAASDGSLAVSGFAESDDSRGVPFVAWIPPDRSSRTVIRTRPFHPEPVVLAADGVIWAAGVNVNDSTRALTAVNILRRYSNSGELLSSKTVEGAKSGDLGPIVDSGSWLLASRDRVVWMTNAFEAIEFSLQGEELRRINGPVGLAHRYQQAGIALSANNRLVVGRGSGGEFDILGLDLTSKDPGWVPLSIPDSGLKGLIYVLGFDGLDLLVAGQERGLIRRFKPVLERP